MYTAPGYDADGFEWHEKRREIIREQQFDRSRMEQMKKAFRRKSFAKILEIYLRC